MRNIAFFLLAVVLCACGAASGTTSALPMTPVSTSAPIEQPTNPPTDAPAAQPTAAPTTEPTEQPANTPTDATVPAEPTAGQPTEETMPDSQTTMVALAIADLAKRLGVAPNDITVTSVEAVEWNNSSLGCPTPGQMYMQVITPGYQIVLTASGKAYNYHTDAQKRVVQCDQNTTISGKTRS